MAESFQNQETLWEKEKLLIMSNSSGVFIRLVQQACKNQGLFGKGFMNLKKMALENSVGKEENAGNQYFLLFLQCFLHYQREKSLYKHDLFFRLELLSI